MQQFGSIIMGCDLYRYAKQVPDEYANSRARSGSLFKSVAIKAFHIYWTTLKGIKI